LLSSEPHHFIELDLHRGTLHIQAGFQLQAPWTVLFGPSGSGKSSILRAIAGLIPDSSGLFAVAGQSGPIEFEGHDDRRTPTHLRGLAYAPQGAIVFPHLTVRQNVAFTAESPLVDTLLDLFHLAPLAGRSPRALSGGERQRIALARAFAVPAPHLMLLDEPFTGLDRPLRDELLPQMAAHLAARNIPVLSVTHDVEEALLLNAEVIRIAAGQITAQGPAHEVLAHERAQILRVLSPNPNP
jgi:ABC-type sulfate/molybdate transport systems ATPase subunit